jgi:hypothetical protein
MLLRNFLMAACGCHGTWRLGDFANETVTQLRERVGDQIPGESFESLVVLFSPTETVMLPAPEPEEAAPEADAANNAPIGDFRMRGRLDGMVNRMRMTSSARSDHESLMVAHVDLETGAIVENRTFMGRVFLISGERPQPQWRITGEQSEFAGFVVMKATANDGERQIEAWFTPQIPVPGGPGEYGGLPGMILSLSIDEGRVVYSATGVSLTPVDPGAIRAPTEGEEISRDDYEVIVAERLEEIETLQSQRRRRRPGGGR